MYIERIENPDDLKKFQIEDLPKIAEEVRKLIIKKVSTNGGHLASNLGVVELTIALHYVFDSPKDKLIFDVSHQTYSHKILTGRKDAFIFGDKYKTVTGFSNPYESEHDLFAIGHTSTSVSLALGLAKARELMHEKYNVVAIIGDGSLDGGEAFEALNYALELNGNLIVIVNDNQMSIPENYGALGKHLEKLRKTSGKSSDNFFVSLGFDYHFVKNGNNISELIDTLQEVKDLERPVVVHVCTQKGCGYKMAEEDKEKWHWARPFDEATGEFLTKVPQENYGNIVGEYLLNKLKKDSKVAVIAASTPICIGFNKERREKAGKQYIDVGIAEQNAVTLSAAMAKGGCKPIFATNSTFLQRAYDQIIQEMCLNCAPATILVTHASVYGHYNDSHVGLYDIPLLSHIPNLKYLAPVNAEEYIAMLDWSIEQQNTPVAIRVPWTGVTHTDYEVDANYDKVSYKVMQEGEKVCIIALGGFFELGKKTADLFYKETGIVPTLINPRFITGIDEESLEKIKENHQVVVTLEDGLLSGGYGAKVAQYYSQSDIKVHNYGFSMDIPRVFNPDELMKKNNLSETQIVHTLIEKYFTNGTK